MSYVKTRTSRAIVAAALLGALAGCSGKAADPMVTGTPSTSSPSSTTSSSTPLSESEIASEAASALVRKYLATIDQLRQDSKRSGGELNTLASSTELLVQKKFLKSQRDHGLRQVGDTRIVKLTVESVSVVRPATAYVDVCWDVKGVDVVDADEKSVVMPSRKDVGWTRFTVTNASSTPTNGWRVSGSSDLEKQPCAGS